MAEINKLSAGQALEKLRRADVVGSKQQHDEKLAAVDDEIQRLRAARLRLERDQRAGQRADRDDRTTRSSPFNKLTWMVILAATALPLTAFVILLLMQ